MADVSLNPDSKPGQRKATRRATEIQRYALFAVCAVIAFIAGDIGRGVAQSASWSAFAYGAATMIVAFIVAAAVMRLVDSLTLRAERTRGVERSGNLAKDIRARLEERYPGIRGQAREIDEHELVRRFLDNKSTDEMKS